MKTSEIILFGIVLFLFSIIIWQGCNKPIPATVAKRDTSVNNVVIQQPTREVVATTPKPIIVQVPVPGSTVVIPPQFSPGSIDTGELRRMVKELATELYTARVYKDSVQLQDSIGNRVGVFNYNDSVTRNSIVQRKPSYQLSFPHTYTTITIHEPYKPKTQLFAGIGVNASSTGFSSLEGGLILKNRKDQLYNVKAGINLAGGMTYGLSTYWPIKLKK